MDKRFRTHTLVFDLDDTLFAEREFVLGGLRAAGDWASEALGISGLTEAATKLFESGRRALIFDEALAQIEVKATPELIAKLVSVYRKHEPVLHLLPDAQAILKWASTCFELALISDGFLEVQQRTVAALGLENIFSTIILTDAWGRAHWKPSRRPYDEIMRRMPGPPDGYVYVGDNPRKDFIGARAVGWHTVRVRRVGAEHCDDGASPTEAADREITSLLDLKLLLQPI